MIRTRLTVIAAAAVIALSGCGGSSDGAKSTSDVSNLSADALLVKAKGEVGSNQTISVKGTGVDAGSKMVVNLTFVGKDSSGTIEIDGDKIKLLSVDGKSYFKAEDSFWKSQAADQADQIIALVNGRWIKADGSSDYADLVTLAKRSFITSALKPDGTLKKGTPKTISGVDCLALIDGSSGTLYVAKDDGRPIQLASKKSSDGDLKFTYDKAAAPKAPKASDVFDFASVTG